jgi:uncharacterized protein (DUF4415 family)
MSEDNITTVSADDLDQLESRTDWEALQNKDDAEIERDVASDPDAVLLDRDWFEAARIVDPSSGKKRITIRLDEDVIDFFKQDGPGYQSRINKVLRTYMLSKQLASGEEPSGEEASSNASAENR